MRRSNSTNLQMRIRVYAGDLMRGPGKMELLAHVAEVGSLSRAAKEMGMSYMRAWNLVKELNRDSKRPMVALSRGGTRGGAAALTLLAGKCWPCTSVWSGKAERWPRLTVANSPNC